MEKYIKKYYSEFRQIFNEENFPEVFKKIHEHNQKKHDSKKGEHNLGHFAILYTPFIHRPNIMLIGNNPSWFDKKDAIKGQEIIRKLEKHPPYINSYIKHNHVFAQKMRNIFVKKLNRGDLLEKCVGMNRLWLQTGSEFNTWKTSCNSYSLKFGHSLSKYCETRTKEIIKLIEPKAVLLIGQKAQELFSSDNKPSNIFNVDYPYGKGISMFREQLEHIIDKKKL